MTYAELVALLLDHGDETYAAFQKPLSHSDYDIIGIRIPDLKKIAKEHYRDEDLVFADFEHHHYLEVEMLFVILGMLRSKTIDEKMTFLCENVHYADSWMITDTPNAYLAKLDFDRYFSFFKKTYRSEHLYTRRIAYVVGLKVFRDPRMVQILDWIQDDEECMVTMGQAWLLATMAISCPMEIYEYLRKSSNVTLRRKTISKIVDSFRIKDGDKLLFKSLR